MKARFVDPVQKYLFRPFVWGWLHATTDGLSSHGIENALAYKGKGPVLWSTHLSIPLEPAVISYELINHGALSTWNTPGDNLFKQAGVRGKLISIFLDYNKSVRIQRGYSKDKQEKLEKREKIIAVQGSGEYIWFAQRKGRDKKAQFHSDKGILNMLRDIGKTLGKPQTFIPVAVSYEFIPDAERMARHVLTGVTPPGDDKRSISTDLINNKGRIHVGFGKPIVDSYDSVDQLAQALDSEIRKNYAIWPSTLKAAREKVGLFHESTRAYLRGEEQERVQTYIDHVMRMPEELQHEVHRLHAGPIRTKQDLETALLLARKNNGKTPVFLPE